MWISIGEKAKKIDGRHCRVRADDHLDVNTDLFANERMQSFEKFVVAEPLMLGFAQRPLNSGSRFSIKAARPSWASSDANAR